MLKVYKGFKKNIPNKRLGMSEKNKYGQYFTIDEIASFMVNLIGKDKGAKVLEPSCGKGVCKFQNEVQ